MSSVSAVHPDPMTLGKAWIPSRYDFSTGDYETGAERISPLAIGKDGNEANHIDSGGSVSESGCRWMRGHDSELPLDHMGESQHFVRELYLSALATSQALQRLLVGSRYSAVEEIAMACAGTVGSDMASRLVEAPPRCGLSLFVPSSADPEFGARFSGNIIRAAWGRLSRVRTPELARSK
jgi:hypothetical protein